MTEKGPFEDVNLAAIDQAVREGAATPPSAFRSDTWERNRITVLVDARCLPGYAWLDPDPNPFPRFRLFRAPKETP